MLTGDYQKNKERLKKRLVKGIKTFRRRKNKKQKYYREQYRNLPEEEKKKMC